MARAYMTLTADQHRMYFEARLAGRRLTATEKDVAVRCPFHDDRHASMSVNVGRGLWHCHADCGGGGVVEFEMKFSNCDRETAWANIGEVIGAPEQSFFSQKPEAVYPYTDEDGRPLFEKLRFPGKRFSQRTKDAAGKFIYRLDLVRRVLYRLPELVRSSHAFVTEGEKDADRLTEALLSEEQILAKVLASEWRIAVTTNFEGAGAGKWRAEYGPYFTGKHVTVLPDNDLAGKDRGQEIAKSVAPYAADVRVVELPWLPEHGDVSDYLDEHTIAELLEEIRKAPLWKPEAAALLVEAPKFLASMSPLIDWSVENIIQRDANGFICADPKIGKSWLAVDLILALTLGQPWLGFNIPRPLRTALITREDNPALTRWRMDRLLAGRQSTRADLGGRLYVNSREQSPDFKVDVDFLLVPMIAELRAAKPEFLILDVFNRLHSADENDATEMTAVMEALLRLQAEVGCAIGVVHHFTKMGGGSLTQRLRGSGAISGWAEWMVGIEKCDEHIRKVVFEIKAGDTPAPIYYRINGTDGESKSIDRADWVPEQPKARRNKAEDYIAGRSL